MMNESDTPQNTQEDEKKTPNFAMRRAVAASGLILGLGGGVAGVHAVGEAINDANEKSLYNPIDTATIKVGTGETIITAVEDRINDYFDAHNLDAASIPYDRIVEESQATSAQLKERTGESVTPAGQEIVVTIGASQAGRYDVLVHLPAPAVDAETVVIPAPDTH